jgi:hypothetical protein
MAVLVQNDFVQDVGKANGNRKPVIVQAGMKVDFGEPQNVGQNLS